VMKRALLPPLRVGQAVRANLRRPPWVPPGHFYSPTTCAADVDRALGWEPDLPGVDLREGEQLALAGELAPAMTETPCDRYRPANMYNTADGAVYHAMLRRLRPRRVLEVGSGYTTALLLDTAERHDLDVQVTCVEPYPDRLLSLLREGDEVELVRSGAQDVPVDAYTALEPGDLLFIDSSHVAKAGSDVLWLYLRVLPRLAPGVFVHVHDILWPMEYPEDWLRQGRDWNEAYLLNAFLCHNEEWDVVLFSSWLWALHPETIPAPLRGMRPGSFWMQRHRPGPAA
jgi:predicted O-methyltransferase YrrM